MKKILLFLSLLISVSASAQSLFEYITIPRNDSGVPEWNGVVQVDSTFKQNDLYQKAFQWVVATWANPKEVINYQDAASGYICITGTLAVSTSTNLVKYIDMGFYHYTVNVWVKDGRYKYQIKDMYRKYDKYGYNGTYDNDISVAKTGKKAYQDVCSQMYDAAQAMVRSLEAKMKEPVAKNSGGSDW